MAYIKSQGCSIFRMGSSPQAAIGQVISISGPDGSVGEIDVTHLASTGKEYIGALPDFGTITMEVVWDPKLTSHSAIWTDFLAQTVSSYQIRLSNSPQSTLTFNAYPSQYSANLATDDKVGATISLKISGSVTLA